MLKSQEYWIAPFSPHSNYEGKIALALKIR